MKFVLKSGLLFANLTLLSSPAFSQEPVSTSIVQSAITNAKALGMPEEDCANASKLVATTLKGKYESVNCFSNNIARVWKVNENGNPILDRNRIGYIDITGKEIIPPEYMDITSFKNGLASAMKYSSQTGVRMGVINLKNEIIIPFDYSLVSEFSDGVVVAVKNCDMVIAQYKDPAEYQKCRFGVLDSQNKTLIPFEYQFIGDYKNGVALAQKEDMLGKIDKQGKVVEKFVPRPKMPSKVKRDYI